MAIPANTPWETPGRVECRVGGGVNTVDGPGVIKGCLATCRADITTACDPWYLVTRKRNRRRRKTCVEERNKTNKREREKKKTELVS